MPRAIDHLVITVRDLDHAGAMYSALGFTVGARNVHPWGTHNRLIQFADHSFIELITVGEPEKIPEHAPGQFSFGACVRDAMVRSSGLAMLALTGRDARADALAFRDAGLGDFLPFDFERKGIAADGSEKLVAFSLAFATHATMPGIGLFTCQHHVPENFWSRNAQTHENGATGTARVTMVAENPSDQHIPLASFAGNREMRATSTGIEIALDGSVLEVASDTGFHFRYGVEPLPHASPAFAGITLRVAEIARVIEGARQLGLEGIAQADAFVLPPQPGCATAIRFEPV